MHKFHWDVGGVNTLVCGLSIALLLMFVPLITSGAFVRLAVAIGIAGGLLAIMWFGFARGTYVTIDDNENLYGTLFFVRGKVTPLSEVVSLNARQTFMGAVTEVYVSYRKKDGSFGERGVVSKESLKKEDFKKLLETIHAANPNIEFADDLLTK
jgi:hypothetical protein